MTLKDFEQPVNENYWREVDPPCSFVPERWTYEQKREFRYNELDYLRGAVDFPRFEGKRVLCVGDGAGIDAIEFARAGAFVHAIDMSEKAVALINKHADEAGVWERFIATVWDITAGGLRVDVPQVQGVHFDVTGFYDAVYSFGVLHHIPNVEKALSEITRVLKPGGMFLGMVYNRDSLLYAYSILARGAHEGLTPDEAMRQYSERNPGCPYSKAYWSAELLEMLGSRFSRSAAATCYNVIDLPGHRKARVQVEAPAAHTLGWHLFFEAVK